MSPSPSRLTSFVNDLCQRGPWRIGQITVRPDFSLRHADDATSEHLIQHTRATDARELAKYDDCGAYRPLKTAPNLRHGWELRLTSPSDLRLALDFFYPAAIGTWLAHERGEIRPVPLRETLGRQTGMYRVTQLIRDDQAAQLVEQTCNSATGCLRRILWPLADAVPSPLTESDVPGGTAEVPLLCMEACNLLVAAARPIAKTNLPAK